MNEPPRSYNSLTFLLGCERSGSTWLGNILDAHEEVDFIMEPFAPYASLFPGFPHRNLYMRESSTAVEDLVRQGLGRVLSKKYPLLYRPGRSVRWKVVDHYLMKASRTAHQRLRGAAHLEYLQWELLNLNHSKVPVSMQARKTSRPRHFVLKDLRLNLKIRMLVKAVPEARFVIIVRNPAAQLTSIRRLIEKGHLHELAAALKSLSANPYLDHYPDRYRKWLGNGDLVDVLIAWWFLNYESLIADLRDSGVPMMLIRHEELAARPNVWSEKILVFLGLSPSQSVKEYLQRSTETPPRSGSPLDTFRRSADYSSATIRNADPVIASKLQRIAEGLPCADDLRVYFSGEPALVTQG
jgi:Sulfotransferase family